MAVRDIALFGALLFAFGVGFFIIHFIMGTFVGQMTAVPEINQSNNTLTALQGVTTLTNRLDYVLFGLFIGLCLALIITAWFIPAQPIFMFIYFLVIIVSVVFSTVISNVWGDISQASIFGSTVLSFPITNNILLLLPIYVAVAGFIGVVVMYAKPYIGGR